MPLLYKVVRDNRADYDHLYYGKAVHLNTVDTNAMADIIQRNCSMKKSDVLAVLTELTEVMTDQLQNSMVVKLDGFGSFRLGIRTVGAETEDKFSILKNVKGTKVNFLAEGHKSAGSHKVSRTFLNGCKLQKYDQQSGSKNSTEEPKP